MDILLSAIFSYLLGSISFAVIVSKSLNLQDPRSKGSKNPGATNILRLSGKLPAALTLIGDMAKGTVAVVATDAITQNPTAVATAMLSVFLGHLYPVFFGFKGGKGSATAIGAYIGVSVWLALGVAGVWVLAGFLTSYSSVASIVAALSAPLLVWFMTQNIWIVIATSIIFIFMVIRHRTNIQRLIAGTEDKIKFNRNNSSK